MLGAMGWTEERSKVMTISDPIYYFGTLLAQKTENNYSTFADMAGKKVGTVTGFTLVPELKAVPGIGEAKLYDTSDGVMRDLVAGRIDMAILDPPLVELTINEHPEWDCTKLSSTRSCLPDHVDQVQRGHGDQKGRECAGGRYQCRIADCGTPARTRPSWPIMG